MKIGSWRVSEKIPFYKRANPLKCNDVYINAFTASLYHDKPSTYHSCVLLKFPKIQDYQTCFRIHRRVPK